MKQADIGLIGLAVMGENLIMNMESKGFTVAVYNRTVEKVDAFVNGRAKGKNIIGAHSMQEFVAALAKPRKVFMMVKAGAAVDAMIDRAASHMAVGIRAAAAKALTVGCVAAGTWLGGLIGQPVIGAAVGKKIADVLNAPVLELVEKGVEKIKEVAKSGWQKVKAGVTSVFNKLSNWLFG